MTSTRWAVSLLHLTVAFAIARRSALERMGSPKAVLSSLPALVVAGLAFRLAAPLPQWPTAIQALFLLGAALAITAFVAMGESFSVLPARRSIVSGGPYRIVRHPAYAGEILMIVACAASRFSLASVVLIAVALPFIALRIHAEERLWSDSDTYRRYRTEVRYRLVPCLW